MTTVTVRIDNDELDLMLKRQMVERGITSKEKMILFILESYNRKINESV